jgi:hypothetical protein
MAITQSLNSKANVKKTTGADFPWVVAQPMLSSYFGTSTAAQTVINFGFYLDTTTATDSFFLFVDGKKLTLGASADYQFTSVLSDGTSSQVTLNYPIAAGLTVQAFKLGLRNDTTIRNVALTPPTKQIFLSGSGTYTTPANVLYLKVRMVGGGGGGGGASAGSAGGNTTFGTSLLTANGGAAGTAITLSGTGGSATINSPATGFGIAGGTGQGGENNGATTCIGGSGGNSFFGGGGGGGQGNAGGGSAGAAAATNSGSGGGGGGRSGTGSTGSGGGAGGYLEATIPAASLLATYSYAVGAAGGGGPAGGSTLAGGNGGSGIVIVEEYYQ